MFPKVSFLVAIVAVTVALFASKFSPQLQKLFTAAFVRQSSSSMSTTTATGPHIDTPSSLPLFTTTKPKTPVFFMSHGGPTFMYPDDEMGEPGAYRAVSKVGHFIKNTIRPQFIVVVSAHWEGYNAVEISVPGFEADVFKGTSEPMENELIYDFYGFPDYMYEEKFHSKGSVELAEDIKDTLLKADIKAQLTTRGIDHGVWVPFKVAFSTNKRDDEFWDVDVPLVQVSLRKTDDFKIHRDLGKALSKYRELGGVVICSGMSVHNLRDMGYAFHTGKPMPYIDPFNKLLKGVVSKTADERFQALESLKTDNYTLFKKAHPTSEHFMPIVVAAGAADDEPAKELYASASLSLGWGLYQFGTYEQEVKL